MTFLTQPAAPHTDPPHGEGNYIHLDPLQPLFYWKYYSVQKTLGKKTWTFNAHPFLIGSTELTAEGISLSSSPKSSATRETNLLQYSVSPFLAYKQLSNTSFQSQCDYARCQEGISRTKILQPFFQPVAATLMLIPLASLEHWQSKQRGTLMSFQHPLVMCTLSFTMTLHSQGIPTRKLWAHIFPDALNERV